jgi:hypothetical protein
MGRQRLSVIQGGTWICRVLPGRSKWPHRTPRLMRANNAESRELRPSGLLPSQAWGVGTDAPGPSARGMALVVLVGRYLKLADQRSRGRAGIAVCCRPIPLAGCTISRSEAGAFSL